MENFLHIDNKVR